LQLPGASARCDSAASSDPRRHAPKVRRRETPDIFDRSGDVTRKVGSTRHRSHHGEVAGLLGSSDLAALKITDFEVIDHGASIALTGDCVR
jgi:hypothetical protein